VTFLPDPQCLPKAGDKAAAETGLAAWAEIGTRAEGTDRNDIAAFARDFAGDPAGRALLTALFGNSPYLSQCVLQDAPALKRIIEDGPDALIEDAMADAAPDRPRAEAETMIALRRAKRHVALATAIADIAGAWNLNKVTQTLSRFADQAVGTALATLLWQAGNQGEVALADEDDPAAKAGLFILGLGKLGAHELNYSSDIDLIALDDAERLTYTGRQSPPQFYIRIVQGMVKILETRTRDGYVFRTDLRLRPDPGSTPVAVSAQGAETYYESTGQNWERAALIKARVIGGDRESGAQFLRILEPFLWRKNLDFATINDIHSIKRQINAHRGGDQIAVAGHNLKLGRGGIREIEFFGQTQQLIWGGRVPELRTTATCDTLAALTNEKRISAQTADELKQSYEFLRRAEHRLQMVDDRQTHSLPEDDAGLERFAVFLGYDDAANFAEAVTAHLTTVERHYAQLFEESPTLSAAGNLVFTGGEDDPETLKTLAQMGFADGPMIAERVRTWHRGRFRATRSARARELLTELLPGLLNALSKTANPDAAFRNFDQFLAGLPAGVQIFSLFLANPGLMSLVAEIMGSAPKLALHLAANPSLLDGVLTGDFYGPIEDKDTLRQALDGALSRARHFEETLDLSRRFANDHKFKVGMQILKGTLDCDAAGSALSDLADVVLETLFDFTRSEMAAKHGRVGGGRNADEGRAMCVIALGKLGGHEITENSDLDLLFLYDDPATDGGGDGGDDGGGDGGGDDDGDAGHSDGPRPLAASQYFARLSQQFITAVSAPTAEGELYEVDMRLRPSGNAGPIASSLSAFTQYHDGAAWSWEHMALTRARVVTGPEHFAKRVEQAIHAALTRARDGDALKTDVCDMRARLVRGHPPDSQWDIKYIAGGLIDVEFIAQYLQLRHAHDEPLVLDTNTCTALEKLSQSGKLDPATAQRLIRAGRLWLGLQGMLRFTFEGSFDEGAAPAGLKQALAQAADTEDFEALKAHMADTAQTVRQIFIDLIGDPDAVAS
jgi:glutamate-ammonia-ligase adenylyltransferase